VSKISHPRTECLANDSFFSSSALVAIIDIFVEATGSDNLEVIPTTLLSLVEHSIKHFYSEGAVQVPGILDIVIALERLLGLLSAAIIIPSITAVSLWLCLLVRDPSSLFSVDHYNNTVST
jgi:hypothetical protein